MAFIFFVYVSSSLIVVMLLKITKIVAPSPISFDLMLKYRAGSDNLKI